MKNEVVLRPSYWASVSGGKDSLFMLYLILNNLDKYPLDGVVHFELEIDFPFIKDVIDYMESECKKFGIMFVRIKPRKSWYDLVEERGLPDRKRRWCNSYKLDSQLQMKEFLYSRGEQLISYIGYCVDETYRYEKRKDANITEIYPLVRERIEESYILEWAKNQPIFNDYYKFNRRCGCMYCPMASRMNMAYLLKYYPENYEWYMNKCIEHENNIKEKTGKPYSAFDGKPQYNAKYVDKVIRNKWIPKLERMVNNESN